MILKWGVEKYGKKVVPKMSDIQTGESYKNRVSDDGIWGSNSDHHNTVLGVSDGDKIRK